MTTLTDSREGYGRVSRMLHWLMALLFVWQFTSALLHLLASDTAVEGFFWSTHYSVGFTLWVLVFVRGAWGLANWRKRPPHHGSLSERLAPVGHLALYLLMIVVPTLAVLRAIGNGRGFAVYGIQLVARGGEPNPALTAPANAAHGLLGWVLLALIVGHVGMALLHTIVWRDGTLGRMWRGHGARRVSPAPRRP